MGRSYGMNQKSLEGNPSGFDDRTFQEPCNRIAYFVSKQCFVRHIVA